MERLFQRLLEATLLTVLLLLVPLELLAQEKEALQPSSGSSAFSKDLQEPQKTQTDEQRATEPPLAQSGCWTSPERDKHVRVIEQSVTAGRLIHKVPPKYPKSARKAHIEGTVVLCAEIRKDGKVANLRVLSGPKELIDPSIKAVQQWVYKPYLLDGEPVEVETDIRVNFRLE